MRRRAPRTPLPAGFGTIWTSVAVDLVGFGVVFPLLPLYAQRLHASATTVGALFSSFSVAQLLFAPVWGRLSDRVGRKPVLLLSLAGTAVGSLLTGLAGSLALLFVGRVIDGVSGASVSVAHAAVADVATPEERPRLFGLLGAAFGVGFVAGPAIGALAALGDARLPFFVAAGIAGANAVVAARRLPETNRSRRAAAPAGPVSWTPQTGLEDEVVVVDDAPAESPGPNGIARLLAVAFVSLVAFSAFEVTFPLFGHLRLGFRLSSTAGVFAAIGLLLAAVQASLVHPAVRRFGEAGTLRLGLLVNSGGLLVLAAVHSWWLLVPALAALVVGQGLAMPALTSAFAGRAAPDRTGGVLGVQQSASGMARVLGPLAGGFAFDRLGAPSPYLIGAAMMALCAVVLVPRSPG
ncbi:MAG: Tetracycline resistance efflux pump [Acidimicrobiales bacterium]|nr:Tetracycline resistance efflux pump [Acidimicrobiales bacterium]